MVHGVQAPLVLSAGDVALLPHGGPHRLRDARGSALTPFGERECRRAQTCQPIRFGGHGRPTTLVVCAFRFRAAHHSLSIQRLARSIRLATGDPATSPALSASTQLLIEESASTKPGSTVVVNRLAGILLIHAIRTHLAGSQCAAHGLRAVADPQIGHALALIHGHPEKPWTVQSLGKAVSPSRSAFAARFSTLVGTSPADYLTRWRMTKAAERLRDRHTAIGEIAACSGYRSEAAFNRAFKRIEHITPGAYRRRNSRYALAPGTAASAGAGPVPPGSSPFRDSSRLNRSAQ